MNIEKQIAETRAISKEIQKTGLGEHLCDAIAVGVFDAGYRKATDVAADIFAEIEKMLNIQAKIVCKTRENAREADEHMLSFLAMLDGRIYSLRVVEEHIAELKKKYTGEGK